MKPVCGKREGICRGGVCGCKRTDDGAFSPAVRMPTCALPDTPWGVYQRLSLLPAACRSQESTMSRSNS